MHERLEIALADKIEEMKDEEGRFSEKQMNIIKSLPEEERLAIFHAMQQDKLNSSSYSMWSEIRRYWKLITSLVILILLVTAYFTDSFDEAWILVQLLLGF